VTGRGRVGGAGRVDDDNNLSVMSRGEEQIGNRCDYGYYYVNGLNAEMYLSSKRSFI
jgi:hypothetical protein